MPGPAPLTSGFVAINKCSPAQTPPAVSPPVLHQAHDAQKTGYVKQANHVNHVHHGQPHQVPQTNTQPSPQFIPNQMPPPPPQQPQQAHQQQQQHQHHQQQLQQQQQQQAQLQQQAQQQQHHHHQQQQQQYSPQLQYDMAYHRHAIRPDHMEIDDGNDSDATVSEREDGHVDYEPHYQTVNLGPYRESIPWIFSPPRHVPYATSVEVVTLLTDTPLRIKPLYAHDDLQSEQAFMERLFNIGNIIGKGGHAPIFSSSTGEYRFFAERDREVAAAYGFANEEQMFKYLDDIKGTGEIPDPAEKRFQCPWHEIDVIFEPRKRGNVEPSKRRPKAVVVKPDRDMATDREEPTSSPNNEPGEDTVMTNGDTTDYTSISLPSIPSFPMSDAAAAAAAAAAAMNPPKKKYQVPKRIPVDAISHPICMEDLIHAVTRHPLLLPSNPVTVDFIIAHAPHLLQNVSLLYILAHGELENEGLSERLGKLGLDVAPNVLAHRKKKALMDMGGVYGDRKPQYEAYKKTLKRKPGWRKGTSGLGLGC
ncbi:hypothetical protein EJ05DRAFT_484331 [Pseudovirgaria hyperparasitica]|uniref:Uncharacterized protein n=1 Tax=Pseudovirgaria hyperparasitica TaxID=470096 RepID=A0A6A6WF15_9PEZI|nr:uncharacterized protein EJ05DRAFT_484331 [Pseudovirgaria hyperparasitica]KAF2760624.1 hypothetical protein EJ05DRAFT_484331 [Pseudovirgaria hyperparasitica]